MDFLAQDGGINLYRRLIVEKIFDVGQNELCNKSKWSIIQEVPALLARSRDFDVLHCRSTKTESTRVIVPFGIGL